MFVPINNEEMLYYMFISIPFIINFIVDVVYVTNAIAGIIGFAGDVCSIASFVLAVVLLLKRKEPQSSSMKRHI